MGKKISQVSLYAYMNLVDEHHEQLNNISDDIATMKADLRAL